MKTKKLLLSLVLFLSVFMIKAQCFVTPAHNVVSPCQIQFYGTGSGISTIDWDFGDGTTGTGYMPPVHNYTSNGTYTVCCIGNDFGGSPCDTVCFPVTISGCSGTSCAIYTTYNTVSPCQLQFYVTGGPATYSWNFGDGVGTATGSTPSYTYSSNGTYTVCCIGYDSGGIPCDTSCFPVTVSGCVTPSCTIYTTYNNVSSCQVQFYVTGGPATYSWNFGDGVGTGTGVTPTYTYTADGTYTVCCVGLDGSGAPCDTSCFPVIISGCVSGVNEYSNAAEVNLYPNPANNMINIEADKLNVDSYKVVDITGKLIMHSEINTGNFTVNVNELQEGMYSIMLYGKNTELLAAKRFVKTK